MEKFLYTDKNHSRDRILSVFCWVLRALAISKLLPTGIKSRFIPLQGHAEDLPSLRQDVKVLYWKRQDLLRNLHRMLPGYVISNFKWVNSFSKLRQFIEKSNKRVFVFAVSVLFSLVECLKVKCEEVFLKIHESKTKVMWSSIVVVFPSDSSSHRWTLTKAFVSRKKSVILF